MVDRRPNNPLPQQDIERYRLAAQQPDALNVLFKESPMGVPTNPLDREFLLDMARTRIAAKDRQDLARCVSNYLERDPDIIARNKEALDLLGQKLPLPSPDQDFVAEQVAIPGEYGQRELNS